MANSSIALGSSINLRNINKSLSGLADSVRSARSSASNITKSLVKGNREKRKSLSLSASLFRRRREATLRREREDIIEARTIGGSVKRSGKVIMSSTKGFLGRIMDFLGVVLLGWAVNNLPKIIALVESLIKRMQTYFGILQNFVSGVAQTLTGFVELLRGVAVDISTFNFANIGKTFNTSLNKMKLGFDRIMNSTSKGVRILTQDALSMMKMMGVDLSGLSIPNLSEDEPSSTDKDQTTETKTETKTETEEERNPPTKGPVDTGLKDYLGRPIRLSAAAAAAFLDMVEAAEADGIPNLSSYITSSLRDPKKNAGVGGVEGSNHLTGNAFDINMLNPGPGDEWIQRNGSRFGFIYNTYSPDSTHFDFVPSKYKSPRLDQKIEPVQQDQREPIEQPSEKSEPFRTNTILDSLLDIFQQKPQERSSITGPEGMAVASAKNQVVIIKTGGGAPAPKPNPVMVGGESDLFAQKTGLNSMNMIDIYAINAIG